MPLANPWLGESMPDRRLERIDLEERIHNLLSSQNMCVLATSGPRGPLATPVRFFALDFALMFTASPRSPKMRNIEVLRTRWIVLDTATIRNPPRTARTGSHWATKESRLSPSNSRWAPRFRLESSGGGVQVTLFGDARRLAGGEEVGGVCVVGAAGELEEVGVDGVQAVGVRAAAVVEQRVDQLQGGQRAAGLGNGNGAIERHDRSGGDALEHLVELLDLRPVGRLGGGASSWTAAMAAWSWYGPTGPTGRAASTSSMPSAIWSRFHSARSCSASGMKDPSVPMRAHAAGIGEQHQGEQAGHLAVVGERPVQLARQADGLGAERRDGQAAPGRRGVCPSVKTRYSTWATAATRAGISVTGGRPNGSATSSSRALARTMRCAMVDSGTRNERAICAVVRPATARSVSATCDGRLSDGWQHSSITASVSSRSTDASSGPTVLRSVRRSASGHALLAPGAGVVGAQPIDEPARRHPDQPGLRIVGHSLGGPLASGGDERLLQRVLGGVEWP